MKTRIPLAVLASALLLASAGPTHAHAHLRSAVPAMDGTVATAPAELDLTFSEGVNPKFSGATVTGPTGAAVATGTAKPGPGGDATLVVPLAGPLGAGSYRVDWHALATDGHKTEGTYSFTVRP